MKKRVTSVVLALCMLLALLPVSVWAEDSSSAATSADELQKLINDGAADVQLGSDVNFTDKSLIIPVNSEITLDLNGYQLSSNISPVVAVEGKLTVTDSTAAAAPAIGSDNVVTYTSGSITAGGKRDAVQVRNGGTFTLEQGTLKAGNAAVCVDGVISGAGKASTAVIKGGYVQAREAAVLVRGQGAKAVIEGGVLLSEDNAVVSGNGQSQYAGTAIEMSGGTLISKIVTPGYITCGIYHPQKGTLNITGGEIRASGGVGILMRGGSLVLDKDPAKELKITVDGDGEGKIGDAGLNIRAGSAVVLDQKSGYYDNGSLMFEAKKQPSDTTDLSQYTVKEYVSDGFELKKETTADGIKYSIKKEETTPTTYTITFEANGGTLSGASTMTTGTDGKLASLPGTPTRTDYTFLGWYTGKNGGTEVTKDTVFTKDTTVYAIWEATGGTTPVTYTVTFYLDKDDTTQVHATQTTKADHTIDWPSAPSKADYAFKGWFDADNKPYTAGAKFFANTSLYAQWEKTDDPDDTKKTFTITLDANGGTLSGANSVTTNENGKLDAVPATPTREGYTFDGWFTAASGGEKVDLESTFTQDSTIYAQWTRNSGSSSDEDEYRIYAPGSVSGGRVYVSHSTAAPGTRVTIELRPWSDYELDWLSVVNLNTDRELRLTERYSDEYTFIMPYSDVEVEVSYTGRYYGYGTYYVQDETPVDPKPVKWYYNGGRIYHTADGLVPYGNQLTRDMLLSVLYNMDPSSSGDPTIWAANNGIIPDIYISVLWGVDKPITREQTAMILYCYAQHMGYSTSQSTSLAGYTDYRQIRDVARPAVAWAKAAGLISGTSASTLSPQAVLTCEQANAILSRFAVNVARTW